MATLLNTGALAQVQMLGTPSCGEWVTETRKNSATSIAFGFWLTGYLSGIAYGSGKDVLKDRPDREGLLLWIENYCQKNPLSKVNEAAQELARELLKKSKP